MHNEDGEIVIDPKDKVNIITAFLESLLDNVAPFRHIPPEKLNVRFTAEEIKKAASKPRNGKSTACDNLAAEVVKADTEELHQEIGNILNIVAETGHYPKELKHVLLLPLRRKKRQGPCKSLRPIILLSVPRKILAISIVQRTFDGLRKAISVSQAAYSPGRGASELILTFKLLAERAMTSSDYAFHMLVGATSGGTSASPAEVGGGLSSIIISTQISYGQPNYPGTAWFHDGNIQLHSTLPLLTITTTTATVTTTAPTSKCYMKGSMGKCFHVHVMSSRLLNSGLYNRDTTCYNIRYNRNMKPYTLVHQLIEI